MGSMSSQDLQPARQQRGSSKPGMASAAVGKRGGTQHGGAGADCSIRDWAMDACAVGFARQAINVQALQAALRESEEQRLRARAREAAARSSAQVLHSHLDRAAAPALQAMPAAPRGEGLSRAGAGIDSEVRGGIAPGLEDRLADAVGLLRRVDDSAASAPCAHGRKRSDSGACYSSSEQAWAATLCPASGCIQNMSAVGTAGTERHMGSTAAPLPSREVPGRISADWAGQALPCRGPALAVRPGSAPLRTARDVSPAVHASNRVQASVDHGVSSQLAERMRARSRSPLRASGQAWAELSRVLEERSSDLSAQDSSQVGAALEATLAPTAPATVLGPEPGIAGSSAGPLGGRLDKSRLSAHAAATDQGRHGDAPVLGLSVFVGDRAGSEVGGRIEGVEGRMRFSSDWALVDERVRNLLGDYAAQ
jgi:hypothetical protein